jgi:hypothetical protein
LLEMTQYITPYKIHEIAEIWNCTEHHILELAAIGNIKISFWWSGNYWFYHNGKLIENDKSNPLNEFVNIEKEDVQYLLHGVYVEEVGGTETWTVSRQNGESIQLVIPSHEENTVNPPIIKISSLRILPDEVERFTHNHPEMSLKRSGQQVQHKDDCSYKGDKVKHWKGIAEYMACSITTAKAKLIPKNPDGKESKRRWCHQAIVQGGKSSGHVWAWSKALDFVLDNPTGTVRRNQIK